MHYITLDSNISFKANKHFNVDENRQCHVEGLKCSLHLVAVLNETGVASLVHLSAVWYVVQGEPIRSVTFVWSPLLRKWRINYLIYK